MTERLTIVEIELPLRRPLVTIGGTHLSRRSLLVAIESGGCRGWGEAPSFPSGRFGTADEAWRSLHDHTSSAGLPAVPIAAAALQAARADLASRHADVPLYGWLGGTNRPVVARHPIGISQPAEVGEISRELTDRGVRAIKLKISPGHDLETVARLRAALPDLDIGVDTNGSYRNPDDAVFEGLRDQGVSFVEQPFPADALDSHAALRERDVVSVCLDETLDDPARAHEAIVGGAADMVSIKLNRHGLTRFKELADLATTNGLAVRVGGTFDSSIGRLHILAAATLEGVTDAAVGPPTGYLSADIAEFPPLTDGTVTPGEARGIGVEPDPERLRMLTVRSSTIDV